MAFVSIKYLVWTGPNSAFCGGIKNYLYLTAHYQLVLYSLFRKKIYKSII